MAQIAFFGISDPGLKRTNNEDHFIVADLTRKTLGVKNNCVLSRLVPHAVGPQGTLLAVADGLGGYEAGEVASQLAVEVTAQALCAPKDATLSPAKQLFRAIRVAHRAIRQRQGPTSHNGSMSSTLTAVHIGQQVMTVAQVGDSRAYLYARGCLVQLTEDQTMVNMLQKKGLITEEEARTHTERHLVLQALGQGENILPDMRRFRFRDNDCLLLCTDGLSSYVTDKQIKAILRTEDSEDARCRCLIEAANAAGGKDNVTVLIARLKR
ncbi:MAG TPA: protein phosphatase 2C domain-containing protein [Candidatus Tectomicrobia bacterium]|jgi:protein phosphatase